MKLSSTQNFFTPIPKMLRSFKRALKKLTMKKKIHTNSPIKPPIKPADFQPIKCPIISPPLTSLSLFFEKALPR
ncbi:hypothetical protein Syun_015763 [Stephania yunnanensis]|uniref:Uncharacterized protein n=1 Tax=Stephania yunnanensis TaxID=152371 RepID=A0AAP0P9M9_9MAGN